MLGIRISLKTKHQLPSLNPQELYLVLVRMAHRDPSSREPTSLLFCGGGGGTHVNMLSGLYKMDVSYSTIPFGEGCT